MKSFNLHSSYAAMEIPARTQELRLAEFPDKKSNWGTV